MVGVTSGALWSGSALDPWWGNGPTTPPSDENTFDTTLGQLQSQSSTYATNFAASYFTALDNIYSDGGKLSQTGAKTANPSSTGWYFNNEVSLQALGARLPDAVRRSMYVQLLPKFYSLDTYTQQPVAVLDKLGMFYSTSGAGVGAQNSCTASYPSSLPSNAYQYRVYPSPSSTGKTDMYVLGGQIYSQGTQHVSESFPSGLLLNTLFNAPSEGDESGTGPLNIPQDILYGTFAMPYRQGPNQGTYQGVTQCYKPGCSDFTDVNKVNQSSCINP